LQSLEKYIKIIRKIKIFVEQIVVAVQALQPAIHTEKQKIIMNNATQASPSHKDKTKLLKKIL